MLVQWHPCTVAAASTENRLDQVGIRQPAKQFLIDVSMHWFTSTALSSGVAPRGRGLSFERLLILMIHDSFEREDFELVESSESSEAQPSLLYSSGYHSTTVLANARFFLHHFESCSRHTSVSALWLVAAVPEKENHLPLSAPAAFDEVSLLRQQGKLSSALVLLTSSGLLSQGNYYYENSSLQSSADF